MYIQVSWYILGIKNPKKNLGFIYKKKYKALIEAINATITYSLDILGLNNSLQEGNCKNKPY